MNAPIILFVYNRPDHTRLTIEALKNNELASESILYIYSDGSRSESDDHKVAAVRELISNLEGFKAVHLLLQKSNLGLATSIRNGVSEIIQKFGKVIVLEDDIVTSPSFIKYMNLALDFYESNDKVWHISGWNYPIKDEGLDHFFFSRIMNCWGWATWESRWKHYEKNPSKILKWDKKLKFDFNLEGHGDFLIQVKKNFSNRLETWAVFWYATIFINKGFCLSPKHSLVANIGLDGSGENCGITKKFDTEVFHTSNFTFPNLVEESKLARSLIIDFYKKQKPTLIFRISRKFKSLAKRALK